jgi:hypothetical protein
MKNTENNMLEQFVYFILPYMIIIFGLIGNLLGLVSLAKRKQADSEIGPIHMYRFLFIIDSVVLITFINVTMERVYSIGLVYFHFFFCKLLIFFTLSLCSLSSFVLIYILIESFLSIKYPVESNLLRKNKPQFIYTIVIFFINLLYFSPIILSYNITQLKSTKINNNNNNNVTSNLTCALESKNEILLTFINRILLPLILILFFSTILVYKILKSKNRINTFYNDRERRQFKNDVYLSVISISFNFIQYSFSLPLIIVSCIYDDTQSAIFFLCENIFHFSYAFNFYFLLLVNSSIVQRNN